MTNDWLIKRLPRWTTSRSIPALITSVGIHGVLVVLIVAGATAGSVADSPDSGPSPGIIGSADHGGGSGVGGALTPPQPGRSLTALEGLQYVGQYRRPGEGVSTIQVGLINDGESEPHWALTVIDGDRPVQKLVWIAADTFALQLAPKQRIVFRRIGDSVSAISIQRGGGTTWAERVP